MNIFSSYQRKRNTIQFNRLIRFKKEETNTILIKKMQKKSLLLTFFVNFNPKLIKKSKKTFFLLKRIENEIDFFFFCYTFVISNSITECIRVSFEKI